MQVTLTDLACCHRFTRFVVPERNQEKIKEKVGQMIEEAKTIETGILYYRLQEDDDIINEENKASESSGKSKLGRYYTLCIIANPLKNTPPIFSQEEVEKKNEEQIEDDTEGNIIIIPEEVIKAEEGIAGKLSAWVKLFHKNIVPFCGEPPIFFELRPHIFKQ